MRDIYTETLISPVPNPFQKVLRTVLIALTVVLLLLGLWLHWIFFAGAAVLAFCVYRLMQKTNMEYEYIHTNDDFDVDGVLFNSSRKHLFSVKLDQVILVAPAEDEEVASFRGIPTKNYGGGAKEEDLYAMVYTKGGQREKVLLKLDDRMLRSLKSWIPGKCRR